MGEDEASIFVTSNIANIVSHTDHGMLSILQFSIQELKVPHIIVCGHYDCVGVYKAITENKDDDTFYLASWLRNILDV